MPAEAIKERADAALAKTAEARDLAEALVAEAQNLMDEDPVPIEFTGVIHDYRFGTDGQENVTHRFEVECTGGLWLHVRCPSNSFDQFVKGTTLDSLDSGMLNGKVVEVRRSISAKTILPIRLLGAVYGLDTRGEYVYPGCNVLSPPSGTEAEVIRLVEGQIGGTQASPIVVVRFTDGSETNFVTSDLTKQS